MNILGINSFFEHPAACLVVDGKLVFAVEDERLTRIKHGKRYSPYRTYIPYGAICSALRFAGITAEDVDVVSYSYNRFHHLRALWGCLTGNRISSLSEELAAFRAVKNVRSALLHGHELPYGERDVWQRGGFAKARYKEWDHHISHAASAFSCSGFDEALIVVADGSGEQSCTSIYTGQGSTIKKVRSFDLPNSLGFFYSFLTTYLGFEAFSDEYKVMGMSSYGEPRFLNEMRTILSVANGEYRLDFNAIRNLTRYFGPPRALGEEIGQHHFDVACSAQRVLEETLLEVIGHHLKHRAQKKLCLAGGTFLNCVANAKIADHFGASEVFVQPAAHDAGTAIGAAALSWAEASGQGQLDFSNMFLGDVRDDGKIRQALVESRLAFEHIQDPNRLAQVVAEELAGEKVLALFRGRSEFGPRALGATSFLASPKSAKTRTKLNSIKSREQFRPLAPIVLAQSFDRYFVGAANRFMMMAVKATQQAKDEAPAIVHVDGTSRAQVVHQDDDAFLHDVLTRFGQATGTPILINTSLNVRGEPMCERPADAIAAAYTSDVDVLCMGSYIVRRSQ